MDDYTRRRVEALIGIYSHPDVTKFILNVLTYFETPINNHSLKIKAIPINTNVSQNNTNIIQPFLINQNSNIFNANTNPFTFNKNITTNPNNGFNNIANPANPANPNNCFNNIANPTNPNNGFNNIANPTNPNNSFNNIANPANPANLNNGFNNIANPTNPNIGFNNIANPANQNNGFNNIANSVNPNNGFTNNIQNFSNISNISNIPNVVKSHELTSCFPVQITDINDLFMLTKEFIEKKTDLNLGCSMAKHISDNNIIFISKKNDENNVILPKNYIWIEDEKKLLNDYLFNIINFKNISAQNDEFNKNSYLLVHNFILSFEKLLTSQLIPCMNDSNLSKKINDKIIESITIPVLIAFENEFTNSPYCLIFYLINNKNYNNYNKYLENLNFNKEEILKIIGENIITDGILIHIYKNVQLVNYFITNK